MRARGRVRTGFCTALLVLCGLLSPLGSPSAVAAPGEPTVAWTPCRDGFECGTLYAPLDYDRPDGVRVAVSLIRLRAGDPARRIGSLLLNPGGPGGSGVDFARAVAQFLPLELRGRFDVIGFDPRGTNRSTPLRCFATFEEAEQAVPPFAFPVVAAEERAQHRYDQRLGRACAEHGGPILGHMSTADTARDMELIRRAQGDRRLNFLGFSYGSFLGQTYANLFPDRVRAFVLDGVLDPIAWTTGRGEEARTVPVSTRLKSDESAYQTLGEFFRLCDAAGRYCAFAGAARQRFADLAERLRRHPIVWTDETGTYTFGYADLVSLTLSALYAAPFWPTLAEALAGLETDASAGSARRAVTAVRAGLGLADEQEPYPNFVEGGTGVLCSDSLNPASYTAWPRAAAAADRRAPYFGRAWTWLSSVCGSWPSAAGADRHLGPWTARTASPVLVVGNYFDPATRYQGAETASRLLPNSRLLSYAGWGHTAFLGGNYCIDSKVTRYLVATYVPPAGTVCKPAGSPFGPADNAPTATVVAKTAALLPPSLRIALTPRSATRWSQPA